MLALVLFVVDLTVTSHGLMTLAGMVCFILGAGALYTQPGPAEPGVGVAWPIIAAMSGLTGAFMLVVVAAAWRVRHRVRLPIGLGRQPGRRHRRRAGRDAGERPASARAVGTVYAGGRGMERAQRGRWRP